MRDPDSTKALMTAGSPTHVKEESAINARLIRNVLSNWTWYVVVVGSGFVIPRLINNYMGRELLGIWDLGWSLQFFVGQVSMGINSAITQSVARARALSDAQALNEVFSTSRVILIGCGCVGVVAAAILLAFLSSLLSGISDEQLFTAYAVVALLCAAAIAQVVGGSFNAILTGSERFDILNLVRGCRDVLLLVTMILLLFAGRGLVALAAAVFLLEVACNIAKAIAARRINPSLRWSAKLCRMDIAQHLFGFGGKTVLQNVAQSGTYQLNSILVAAALGPAALALYARQRALVMQLSRFVKQYAQVFVPTMSAATANGQLAQQRRLLIDSTRLGLYISLPFIMFLAIVGDPLVELWMGAEYKAPVVLAILTVGHLLTIPQQGVYSILMGLGRHGWQGIVDLAAAFAITVLTILLLWEFHAGLSGAAIALVVPLAIADGIVMPIYACRVLALPFFKYVKGVGVMPFASTLPLLMMLLICRLVFSNQLLAMILSSLASLSLGASFCIYCAAPLSLRQRFRQKLCAIFSTCSPESAARLAKE